MENRSNIKNANKFLKEVYEQPEALKATLDYFLEGSGKERLSQCAQIREKFKKGRMVFTGMGSSYFISGMASAMLNQYGIASQAINAGELIHYQFPVLNPGTLLICISQSGESYEITRILEKLPDNITGIAITNEPESTLARNSSVVLLSQAGKEFMTSTKTFTSTALAAHILALTLTDRMTAASIFNMRSVVDTVGDLVKKPSPSLQDAVKWIVNAGFVQIVGRGPSMAAVQQGALMFMEGALNPASALFSGEFRHGPMELVKSGFLIIILAPDGNTYTQHLKLAEDIIHFGGRVIFLSNKPAQASRSGLLNINVPCADENLFSIASIVPLQFMVNACAIEKGHIPGEFLRGSKITTRE